MKLFANCAVLLALAVLVYGLVVWTDLTYNKNTDENSNYLAAIIDKVALLERTSSPRIILVGGSNLAFGVDSDKIAARFRMPVVNLGLHVGCGLNLLVELTKRNLRHGDLVVLSPEYELLSGRLYYGDATLLDTLFFSPELFRLIAGPEQIVNLIRTNSFRNDNLLREAIARVVSRGSSAANRFAGNPIYYRHAFNAQGDVVSHLGKQGNPFAMEPLTGKPEMKAVERVSLFREFVLARSARFVLSYPCMPAGRYEHSREAVTAIHLALMARNLVQETEPWAGVYPDNCFFDAQYHLTGECRQMRTQRLMAQIERALPEAGKGE